MRKELYFFAVLLGILLSVFLLGRCSRSGTISEYERMIEGTRLENADLKKEKNSLGQMLVRANYNTETVLQINKSKDSALLALGKEIGGLKRLVSHIQFSTDTRDTFVTVIKERVEVIKGDTVRSNVVEFTDGNLSLYGSVHKNKIRGFYKYKDSYGITTYWEGKRFQKKKLSVLVKPQNPRTDVSEIKPIYIESPPKKWYETRAAAFGIGIITGGLIVVAK